MVESLGPSPDSGGYYLAVTSLTEEPQEVLGRLFVQACLRKAINKELKVVGSPLWRPFSLPQSKSPYARNRGHGARGEHL